MGSYTGTVPTFLAGELPDADKLTEISNFMLAATGAWTTWAPTLTNLTLGNGSVVAKYRRLGQTLDYRFRFIMGSTSAVGTTPSFTLPFTPHAEYTANAQPLGYGFLTNDNTADYDCSVRLTSGSTVNIVSLGTLSIHASVTATAPFTWGTLDSIMVTGTIELA